MTSNSSKTITNDQTGRSFSSEASKRIGRTKQNQKKHYLTNIREEDKTGGEILVETIHPKYKDDPGYRSDYNDKR